jgi:hypothetical protein
MSFFSKSFLLAFGLFITVEVIGRVFFTRALSGRFEYGYHPTAGFVEHPDGRVDLVRAGGRRFFPQSFSQQRPPGTQRVVVVGDSVARGRNVADSYAGQLLNILDHQKIKAEVLNMALPGFGARRKQIVLEQALHYSPTLVVLHVNSSNEYEDEREWMRHEEFKSLHPKNWLMRSVIVRRLYEAKTEKIMWELLPAAIRQNGAVDDADAEVAASLSPAKLKEWDMRVIQHTKASVSAALNAGARVLLVTQCVLSMTDAGPVLDDRGIDAWNAGLAGERVAHLSMKQVFSGRPNLRQLMPDGTHLSGEGHRILAGAIAELLGKKGWDQRGE